MAVSELEPAVLRSALRWYQFSLRGLFLLTLFMAILLSILAVGWTVRVYEATLTVGREPPDSDLTDDSYGVDAMIHSAVQDAAIELATSDVVMDTVAQKVRGNGLERIAGEAVTGRVLRNHMSVHDYGCGFDITAFSNDAEVSKTIATAFCGIWFDIHPVLTPTVAQRYLKSAKSEFSGPCLQDCESRLRDLERSDFSHARRLLRPGEPLMNYYFRRRGAVSVWPTTPYWNLCMAIASIWLTLGIVAFGINRWRRYRAHCSARESSFVLPKAVSDGFGENKKRR